MLAIGSMPVSAVAQSYEPRPSLAFDVGAARFLGPETKLSLLTLRATARLPGSGRLSLEPELMLRRYVSEPARPVTTRLERRMWSAGVNVIMARRTGRVRPFGGGGGGVYWTTLSGVRSTPLLGVQGITGVDAQVSDRIALYAAVRTDAILGSGEFSGLGFQALAGVRFGL